MKHKKFSLIQRIRSFKFAFNGLYILIKEEHNARIHFIASICAITISIILKISSIEWVFIIFSIAIVFILELLNSALENLSDFVSPEIHKLIKKVKDMSAAAVLVATLAALITGLIIFIPKV